MKKLIFLLAIAALLAPPLRGQGDSDTVWTKRVKIRVNAVQFHPDGERILVGGGDGDTKYLLLLDTETGQTIKGYKYKVEEGSFYHGIFSNTGDTVISTYHYNSFHNKILFFDTESGELIENLTIDLQFITIWDMEISGDGTLLYIFGSNSVSEERLLVIDIVTSEIIREINSYDMVPFMEADLSDDGKYIAAVRGIYPYPPPKEWQYYLELRDQQTLESIKNFGSVNVINDLCFSPDGTMIASAGDDGKVKVWDVKNGVLLKELFIPQKTSPRSIDFSPDSKSIFIGNYDGINSSIVDIDSKNIIHTYNTGGKVICSASNTNCIVVARSRNLFLYYAHWEPNTIPEERGSTDFDVFPNPVERILNVHFIIEEPKLTGLEILDVTGALLFEENYGLLVPGEYYKIINTAGLPVGTFFCRLTIGKASHSVKFIISE